MIDWHGLNTGGHILAGTLALAVGLVPMFTRKGGVLHRQAGYVTVALGLIVLGSAVIANILFDPPAPLVAATLSAGYQYLSGMRAAYLKAGPLKPLDIALAVCGLALCGLLWANVAHGSASWSPQIGYSTLGYILVILIYDLSRTFWMSVWHRHVRLLDHGLKMIGFYFAMLSAGAGNLLAQWQPLSQLLPSMIGLVVMIGFGVWYARHPIRPRALAAR